MHVQPNDRPLAEIGAEWVALGVFEAETEPPVSVRATALGELLARLLAGEELSGALGTTTPLFGAPGMKAGAVLVFGLGPRASFGAGDAFSAGVAVARRLCSGKKRRRVAVALPEAGDASAIASAIVEGLVVGSRGSDLRKSEPSRHPFDTIEIVAPADPGRNGEAFADAVGSGIDRRGSRQSRSRPHQYAPRGEAARPPRGAGARGRGSERRRFRGLGRGADRAGTVRRRPRRLRRLRRAPGVRHPRLSSRGRCTHACTRRQRGDV